MQVRDFCQTNYTIQLARRRDKRAGGRPAVTFG
jgi:hypothetical protein